ncbi:MAG: Ig-like domain-containing protein [Gemmatimonadaceae bacterium]
MVRRPHVRSIAMLVVATALLTSCDKPESIGPGGSPAEQFVVSIAPDGDTLNVGATLALSATVRDARGAVRSDQPLTWSSLEPQIASVDNIGLVTGLSVGTAHVVARTGSYADTATLLVEEGALVLSVAPELIEITHGDSIQLEASLATPSGAAVRGEALSIQWTTSDSAIAGIDANGLVTSLTPGDVTFTASVSGKSAVALARVVPNPIVSVSVTPANSGIYPGQSQQLVATIRDIRGRLMKNVHQTWSSSDPAVASVSSSGLVTGRTKGSVIITLRTDAMNASASVNVFAVPASGVIITAASNTVTRGGQLQAVATVRDSDGNVLTGKIVAWSSSNPSVAQVNATGMITGLTVGSTSIHAIVDSKIGTLPISVIGATPTSLAIIPGSATISLGASTGLTAEVKDQGGNVISGQPVSWSSANPAVATVSSSGVVTGVTAGSAVISATSGSLSDQATITVIGASIASVSVSPSSVQLSASGTRQLSAIALDASGNQVPNAAITWSSSNPIVATVSAAGLATAMSSGNATISATSSGKTGSATVSVAAPPPAVVASVTVTLNSSSLLVGQTTQAQAVARDAAGNIITGRPVTWKADDAHIASVSAAGLVTALASGTTAIAAKIDGVTGYEGLTISALAPLPVHTVQLTVSPNTINTGQTASSAVVLRDSLGKTLTGLTVGWSSSKNTVASVGLGGVITGVSAGSAVITATSQGKSGTAGVTVNGSTTVPVASVTVAAGSTSLTVGQTTQATATTKDASGNVLTGRPITWSSSNPSAATVSATGLVTAVAAGSTQILATSGGQTGSLSMTVTAAPVTIASVSVTLAKSSIAAGSSTQATAVAKDASGNPISGVTFFWGTSSAATATVSLGGVVVGVAQGTANITASAAGKTGSAALAVTAAVPPSGVTAVPPALPTSYVNTTYTPPTGQTIHVPAGGNLQTAIDQAKRGDVITLQPGATYTGSFILRGNKAGSGYITIRTAAPDASLPPQGTRLTPSRYASILPKIQTSAFASVFLTEPTTSGYRLLGLEITAAPSLTMLGALVQFGDGSWAQNTLAKVPRDLIIDRSWVHGTATLDLRRCVTFNSAWSAVVDSYLADCHAKGADSQAIIGWNGPGPFKIVNNYLEGAGENIMFGGADPAIPNLNPSDIEIRGNHIYKPLSWQGGKWTVKNLLELKQAVRVLIEGNILEGSWVDGQTGMAVVLKSTNQNGGAPWATTSDVTFRYNVVRNAAGGLGLAAHPEVHPVVLAARVKIEENIFENIGTYAGSTNGRMIMLQQKLDNVEISHNTLLHNAVAGQFILMDNSQGGANLVVRNNVATWGGPWGAVMGNAPQGSQALALFATPYAFEGNVVVGLPGNLTGGYPSNNAYPSSMSLVGLINQAGGNYALGGSSPYKGKGTDGRDPGADIANVRAITANVIVP